MLSVATIAIPLTLVPAAALPPDRVRAASVRQSPVAIHRGSPISREWLFTEALWEPRR